MAKEYKGVLLDITGVLYESGDGLGKVIPGSVDAVNRLKEAGIPLKLVTNETSSPRKDLVAKLVHHGYTVTIDDIFSPIPAVCRIMRQEGYRPHLLINPKVAEEFAEFSKDDPTCVVVGDADTSFSYQNMNEAFNVLLKMKEPKLYSLGMGKYYKHNDKLVLDLGAFTAALEFATGVKAEIVGKPSSSYFQAALDSINICADKAVMVGDDINSDVGGAQNAGMTGILVRTGKYTPMSVKQSFVKPDLIADNLAAAVDFILNKC